MKFLMIEADYTYDNKNRPIIRLYCKNSNDGNDAIVHVVGFKPYIYLDNCDVDISVLKGMVIRLLKGYISEIEVVNKFRPIGYQESTTKMLKITLINPRTVHEVRAILADGIDEITMSKIYEADILFKDRFLVDKGINGMTKFVAVGIIKMSNYGTGCKEIYISHFDNISSTNEIDNIDY